MVLNKPARRNRQVMDSEASTAGTATFIGTPHYLAPEIFGGGTYDERADAWALGCVLYEMICFRRPFHFAEDNVAVMALRISYGTYDTELLEKQASKYPKGLLQITAGLLQLELSTRLRAVDVLSSLCMEESDSKSSDFPSCWDPISVEEASGLPSLGTDSWHDAELQSESRNLKSLGLVIVANKCFFFVQSSHHIA